ncbi:MAG: hypothetical protein AAGG11_21035 [Pseudomonadota bacterium]
MTAVLSQLRALPAQFEARSLRERVMIAVAIVAVLGTLWLLLVDDPLVAAAAAERQRLLAAEQAAQAEVLAQQELRTLQGTTSVANLEADRSRLQDSLDTLGKELDQVVRAFVHPKQMPTVLRELLAAKPGVSLMRIESVDPVPLSVPGGEATGLFQHGYRIRLSGAYFDIVRFLAALEESPWRLAWRRLDYSVVSYPETEVDLEVETLSRERNLIGI